MILGRLAAQILRRLRQLSDISQSLTFGRPPSFSMAYIDCQMAYDTTKTEQGDVEMSCMLLVTSLCFQRSFTPSYSRSLET